MLKFLGGLVLGAALVWWGWHQYVEREVWNYARQHTGVMQIRIGYREEPGFRGEFRWNGYSNLIVTYPTREKAEAVRQKLSNGCTSW